MRHAFDTLDSHAGPAMRALDANLAEHDSLRPIPTWLRDSILDAYRRECIYITSAMRDMAARDELVTLAEIFVPKTFYGDQTGHFNAVESVLCVNQMAFLTMADFIVDERPHAFRQAITTTDLHDFKENVLARTFITSSSTKFRRALTGSAVNLRFRFTMPRRRGDMLFLAADYAFTERDGARSSRPAFYGEATFAIPAM